MTIHDGAKELFNDLGLDRTDVRVVAKSIAQQIIDESDRTGPPLCGMVYDVRTLYDEGVLRCEFSVKEGETVHFRAQLQTEGEGDQVERQRTLDPEALRELVGRLPVLNTLASSS